MCYSYYYGNVYFINACSYKGMIFILHPEEIGEQAVNFIGEERLKKYYFGVED